jgi:hypothetical protein
VVLSKRSFKVVGHIPARTSDVPSWDAETIFFFFFFFERSTKLVQEQLWKKSKFSNMFVISYKFLKEIL